MNYRMTVVIKVGSASLVDENTYQPKLSAFDAIGDTISSIRAASHDVILVSSGSVAIGRGICGLFRKRTSKAMTASLAAVGQTKLMSLWQESFAKTDQQVAQVLLSKETEMSKPNENTRAMISSLLSLDIVPIINENDAVAATPFGGNDVVALLAAKIVDANALVFLTDVDCLYTKNPRTNPDAKPIEVVEDCTKLKIDVSSKGTAIGTGGMESKLIAATLASSLGIATVLNNVSAVHNILNVLHNLTLGSKSQCLQCSLDSSNNDTFAPATISKESSSAQRPTSLHTLFLPQASLR